MCKFNADTDLRHAFRAGLEAVFAQGDRQLEEAMTEGRTQMISATVEKMRLYGCAGKAAGAQGVTDDNTPVSTLTIAAPPSSNTTI